LGGAGCLSESLAVFLRRQIEDAAAHHARRRRRESGHYANQASKLYEAIRGNGGTTRLVMLPHEPHWYSAMESNEQLVYEMLRWFDKYVKNAPPRRDSLCLTLCS
jgi:hypothetical protein